MDSREYFLITIGRQLRKRIDLEDLTPLLHHIYLVLTQRWTDNDETVITSMNELFRRITFPHLGYEPTSKTIKMSSAKASPVDIIWKDIAKDVSKDIVR